jgi:hypothetical protein
MSQGKDQTEKCFFTMVQVVWTMPGKKGRCRPSYVPDETDASQPRFLREKPLPTNTRTEEEQLWVVRYLTQSDLAALPESGYAVFRACNEEQVHQKFTAWLRLVVHEEARIESVQLLSPNALKRLTLRQAREARCQVATKPQASAP